MNNCLFQDDPEFPETLDRYFDLYDISNLYSANKDIAILHFNIRSFAKNSDELFLALSVLNFRPEIIVLSETWFSECYIGDINGYNGYHSFRQNRRGGGVSVFIDSRIRSRGVMEHSFVVNDLEMCTVRLSIGGSDVTIIAVYRPPDRDVLRAVEYLDPVLSAVGSDQRAFVIGDINIDIARPLQVGAEFINCCYSSSFLPHVFAPTHVTDRSSTCLDHIYYNQLDDIRTGVIKIEITDHYPVFAIINRKDNIDSELVTKKFRDHSMFSLNNMRDRLTSFCANFRNDDGDYNAKFDSFSDGILNIYNACCPIRTKSISHRRSMKPWITNSLIICINRKYYLFKMYKRNQISFERYNCYKNALTSLIRRTKERYYRNKFSSSVNNSKKTWGLVNSLIRSSKKCVRSVQEIDILGRRITDPESISCQFNEYFSSVALKLDDAVPNVDRSPLSYLGIPAVNSIFVSPAVNSDVERVISELPCKACDIREIPSFIYKYFSNVLSPMVASLFNESIDSGVFPDKLKTARVVPVHKAGDKTNVNNYRPISTLPFLSKVFEKLMYKRLVSFLSDNDILSNNQFGFRKSRSTSDAVIEWLNNVYESFDNRNILVSIFIDLSKAFDTVNHRILMNKLDNIGIRGGVKSWFGSYISNRKQFVSVSGSNSHVSTLNMGVPQGSTLGPILFLLYINDMSRCSDTLRLVHFADDTTAFFSCEDPVQLVQTVNSELLKVRDWLCANRLTLNVNKTCYMMMTDRNVVTPDVCINGRIIDKVDEAKFLGITVDRKLSFIPHVDNVCKQVARATGILNRFSSLLPFSVRLKIYFALVYSRVSYGILSWGHCSVTSMNRLERVLGRARRTLQGGAPRELLLFNFSSIYMYSVGIKIYQVLKLDQHPYFLELYSSLRPNHDYETRFNSCDKYNVPRYAKAKCQRGFLYQSVSLWNSLPDNIKQIEEFSMFKHRLKMHLRYIQGE